MLRLRPFEILRPTSREEAATLLATQDRPTRVISGGTDLLPNLKLAFGRPEVLVSLRDIDGIDSIRVLDDALEIGAGVILREVAQSPDVNQHVPVLAQAVGGIASPQIRNMGTIGGNICLDTRCRYINQGELFRHALGGCLKSHGNHCPVVPGGKSCVAALSADSVPVLIALGATVDVLASDGSRSMPIQELYGKDGTAHIQLGPGEVITTIHVPIPPASSRLAYRKWAVRKSIDFPLVSVAVRLNLSTEQPATLEGGVAVVGVLGPRPRIVDLARMAGQTLGDALAVDVGDLVFKSCRPVPNVPYDTEYRRKRLRIEAKRAVLSLCAS